MAKRKGSPAGTDRIEHDSMGDLRVPADALWGAQTQRAVQNFPISGRPMPRGFIRALGLIKSAAAEVNTGLGLLPKTQAAAIRSAALLVAEVSRFEVGVVRRQRSEPDRGQQTLADDAQHALPPIGGEHGVR